EKMKYVVTLSNGRTYARIRRVNEYSIVELVEGGSVRFTNMVIPSFGIISKDGSLLTSSTTMLGQAMILRQASLNGFDNLNTPVWSNSPQVIATTPVVTANDPVPWEGFRAEPVTGSDKIIYFDYAKAEFGHGEGFHLGAINRNDNKWLWRTAPGTSRTYTGPFPEDGAFDNGNGVVYAGGIALMNDRNIFWNYHGEFWKQSQTNKWNHVYDNGLMVGQFGELTSDYPGIEAFSGGAGNVRTGTVVTVNGVTYLYHNDEGVHGGLHRWKITGINTIQVQNAIYPTTRPYIPNEGIDLLEGLVRDRTLQNGAFGWNRTPATDNTNTGIYFTATMGNKSYNKFQSPDLFMKYRYSLGNVTVTRELGNNYGLSAWKLWGKVNFDEHTPNEARGRGGSYMEILDRNNLVIARFYIGRDMLSGINIIGNSQVIYNGSEINVDVMKSKSQPIEISAQNGLITISYANRTVTTLQLADATADWRTPTTLRFQFFTNFAADDFARSIDIPELRFVANPMLVLPILNIPLKAYQKEQVIFIDWTNEQESGIHLYEIEKSLDGHHFTKIGALPAKANGSSTNKYTWLDTDPKEGINYYRIKAINNSDPISYSRIVKVEISNLKANIEIYPNPVAHDFFTLRFTHIPQGNYALTLINNTGQIVWSKRIFHGGGGSVSQNFPLHSHLSAGRYDLHIAGNDKTFFRQIIKSN
ncbi:MAG TPA: T9SS type A sorting domain-containing protein, partial [Chitinophagaceae bacterium]|nr:T9SS type A sorting domain-containing protein [Chitinophagaceae bacterium]